MDLTVVLLSECSIRAEGEDYCRSSEHWIKKIATARSGVHIYSFIYLFIYVCIKLCKFDFRVPALNVNFRGAVHVIDVMQL